MTTSLKEPTEQQLRPCSSDITSRIRCEQGDRRITTKALAEQAGMVRSTLAYKLDPQNNAKLSVDEVIALADALSLAWIWLISGDGPKYVDGASKLKEERTFSLVVGGLVVTTRQNAVRWYRQDRGGTVTALRRAS